MCLQFLVPSPLHPQWGADTSALTLDHLGQLLIPDELWQWKTRHELMSTCLPRSQVDPAVPLANCYQSPIRVVWSFHRYSNTLMLRAAWTLRAKCSRASWERMYDFPGVSLLSLLLTFLFRFYSLFGQAGLKEMKAKLAFTRIVSKNWAKFLLHYPAGVNQ